MRRKFDYLRYGYEFSQEEGGAVSQSDLIRMYNTGEIYNNKKKLVKSGETSQEMPNNVKKPTKWKRYFNIAAFITGGFIITAGSIAFCWFLSPPTIPFVLIHAAFLC